MAGSHISQRHGVLEGTDPEFGQVAGIFRRALTTIIGLTAAAFFAAAWLCQPATVLGFVMLFAGTSAIAIVIAASVALVQYR